MFRLPPGGSFSPNSAVDPLRFYYMPLVGRIFVARLDMALGLLPRRRFRRILEIGYGSGLLLPTLAELGEQVDGIDLESDPEVVRASLSRLGAKVGTLVRGDAGELPFADASFDGVVALSVFEHLGRAALERALEEAARVVEPGGSLLVGCPAVHRAMSLAFRAIGFRGIEEHHVSDIHDVIEAAGDRFVLERSRTLPAGLPLGWAPYNAVLLKRPQ